MSNFRFTKSHEHGKRAKALRKEAPMTERLLWNALSPLRLQMGLKFRRQHPVPPYFADFACIKAGLIIEIDGESHDMRQVYDIKRSMELSRKGWKILRFSNEEVLGNLEGVVVTIVEKAQECLRNKLTAHP